ncbi:MAG: sugar phosphorylase [Gammaproteobacteria bacterium]|nr:sugar phosphorylase [Gammaproteobacteria bacterium]
MPARNPPNVAVSPRDACPTRLRRSLDVLVESIYPEQPLAPLVDAILDAFWDEATHPRRRGRSATRALWSEKDAYLITYGNSLQDGQHKPLDLLRAFAEARLRGTINGIHILPYFPYTSDDGFAVTDYTSVDIELGDWADIRRIAAGFRLMSDLVLNHCSSQGPWFNAYRQGHEPWKHFFFEASPADDLDAVVRPRAHPLLREVDTAMGKRYVWCTFSHDQVDLDFSNPAVLCEFLRIMRHHIDNGVRTFRLDAVAFLWKEVGTPCINLRQTHEIVRLLRLLADYDPEPLILITETNLPNIENLSYFGNRNEAHMIYNFSLPPLVLHALYNGTSTYLNAWQMAMPPAQLGCAYLNFTASHDGIGLRPAEGLIPEEQIDAMIATATALGGLVSLRATPDRGKRPYEINIALFDALAGTRDGRDQWQIERFLCSQTIAMGLEGIPAFYIHSLLATPNDHDGVERASHNRAINRHRWHYPDLLARLEQADSNQARVLDEMTRRIRLRIRQPAFHPNATQFTLQLGEALFGFWRQSMDRSQSVFAIHNLGAETITIPAMSLNLIGGDRWHDLLSGETVREFGDDISFAPYQCRWITNR